MPLQILYKGWVQQDLGPVDLEEWTTLNAERVQHMRNVAVLNLEANSDQRKREWDRNAQSRQFEKGDQVYLRKAGLNTKLADSWDGPFVIEKRNTPLSYRVNTGDRCYHRFTSSCSRLTRPGLRSLKCAGLPRFWSLIR